MNHEEGQELVTNTNEWDRISREQNWKLVRPVRPSSNLGSSGMVCLKYTYHLLARSTAYLMLQIWALSYYTASYEG